MPMLFLKFPTTINSNESTEEHFVNYSLCQTCTNPSYCSVCSFHLARLKEQLVIAGIGGRIANEGFLSTADIDDVFATAETVILRLRGVVEQSTVNTTSQYFEEA